MRVRPAAKVRALSARGRLELEDIRRAFCEPYVANWIPLTFLSIAIGDARLLFRVVEDEDFEV